MRIKRIRYTSKFERNFKNLPRNVQKKSFKIEQIFRQDPFHPSLKTHRLKGPMREFYSFSIDYHYRIVFAFEDSNEVTFVDCGDHSVYR